MISSIFWEIFWNIFRKLFCFFREVFRSFYPLRFYPLALSDRFTRIRPNMTGRRFHRTIDMIPAPSPGSLKALLFSPLWSAKYKTRGCKGCERGTTRNFLQSFPLSGAPVVQSYRSLNLRTSLFFAGPTVFGRMGSTSPFLGKSKWGFSNGGLRPLSAICAQLSAIVHVCGLLLRDFSSQNDDNCRQSWSIVAKYLKPPFVKPPFRLSRHSQFYPQFTRRIISLENGPKGRG